MVVEAWSEAPPPPSPRLPPPPKLEPTGTPPPPIAPLGGVGGGLLLYYNHPNSPNPRIKTPGASGLGGPIRIYVGQWDSEGAATAEGAGFWARVKTM